MIQKTIEFNPTGATGNTTYNFTILLTSNYQDLGFFDTYSGLTGSTLLTPTSFTVTGTSSSRISELAKYVVTNAPWDKYYLSNTPTIDGVDLTKSNTGGTGGFYVYTYYIGSITYVDTTPTGSTGSTGTTTIFSFQSLGTGNTNNFDNFHIIKLESKENMVENPIVGSDVNIIRQDIPVFEMTVRLRSMAKLNDVLTYAGGGIFKVYNNS